MSETFFISGLYSGPSPSAGLGVARSLRAAFPSARLIGVDYWAGSSGLHHEVFNSTWLKPSWDLMEQELYAQEIKAELDRGAFWLPTLDLEVHWLARSMSPHARLLSPVESALAPTRKPRPSIVELLPFTMPASVDLTTTPDDEVHAFCRANSWRVWLKGPYHEAVAIKNWRELEQERLRLGERWHTDRLSVQAHVRGYEESICFAALKGKIADAVYVRKRITTPEGKTWAGKVTEVPADLVTPLESAVRELGWTGGAEIEVLRDVDGRLWFLEWNPRFPAWVHGAALSGRNLPAALLRKALGLSEGSRTLSSNAEFTRVVLEIPVRADLPLPLPGEPDHGDVTTFAKYGASLAAIVPRLTAGAGDFAVVSAVSAVSPETERDLAGVGKIRETPHRVFLERTAESAFAQLGSPPSSDGTVLRYAYSLKTSPDAEYLALARHAGMLAECISLLEVKRALEAGFPKEDVILNGPGKWWPKSETAVDGLRAVFCDSIEELERLSKSGRHDRVWGARLRIPGFRSRFGIPVDEPEAFERLCAVVSSLPREREFGVHVHMASMMIGVGHWRDVVESAVVWGSMITSATGRRVHTLDLGGGYHPDDFPRLPLAEIMTFARQNLPGVAQIYVEPGRALTQSTMALVTSVLDVRHRHGKLEEIVVDACIAELPLASAYPHRVFRVAGERIVPAGRGAVRVLGRICMEDDVLFSGLDLPENTAVGDRLVVCDAGAYERSMSYAFGRAGYT
jgi:diaminopimelate decarboxylase